MIQKEEAEKLTCPFANKLFLPAPQQPAIMGAQPQAQILVQHVNCQGPGCMAWQDNGHNTGFGYCKLIDNYWKTEQ